jgi:hypothetical protein
MSNLFMNTRPRLYEITLIPHWVDDVPTTINLRKSKLSERVNEIMRGNSKGGKERESRKCIVALGTSQKVCRGKITCTPPLESLKGNLPQRQQTWWVPFYDLNPQLWNPKVSKIEWRKYIRAWEIICKMQWLVSPLFPY